MQIPNYKIISRPLPRGVLAHSCSNGHVSFTVYQHVKDYYIEGVAYSHKEVLEYAKSLEARWVSSTPSDVEQRVCAALDRLPEQNS